MVRIFLTFGYRNSRKLRQIQIFPPSQFGFLLHNIRQYPDRYAVEKQEFEKKRNALTQNMEKNHPASQAGSRAVFGFVVPCSAH